MCTSNSTRLSAVRNLGWEKWPAFPRFTLKFKCQRAVLNFIISPGHPPSIQPPSSSAYGSKPFGFSLVIRNSQATEYYECCQINHSKNLLTQNYHPEFYLAQRSVIHSYFLYEWCIKDLATLLPCWALDAEILTQKTIIAAVKESSCLPRPEANWSKIDWNWATKVRIQI